MRTPTALCANCKSPNPLEVPSNPPPVLPVPTAAQMHNLVRAPCRCGTVLYTPVCPLCGELRETSFRIPSHRQQAGALLASLYTMEVGTVLPVRFRHPLFPELNWEVTKLTVVKRFRSAPSPGLWVGNEFFALLGTGLKDRLPGRLLPANRRTITANRW